MLRVTRRRVLWKIHTDDDQLRRTILAAPFPICKSIIYAAGRLWTVTRKVVKRFEANLAQARAAAIAETNKNGSRRQSLHSAADMTDDQTKRQH